MIAKSDAASNFRGSRGSGSIEISVPGASTAVGFSGQQKNTGASAADRGRPSLFKTIDEDRRERHDHINGSGRSTYPGRISVLTTGATAFCVIRFLFMEKALAKAPINARRPGASAVWISFRSAVLLTLIAQFSATPVRSAGPREDTFIPSRVPAWVFPLNPPPPASPPTFDKVSSLHVPNSKVSFTEAELNNLFKAPDWHPQSHGAMPSIVANGRPPEVYACGFCHTPGGEGRPENASLAGLPAAYIMSQLADFKSSHRRSARIGPYRPADLMIHAVTNATEEELSTAATYFAAQTLQPRVVVVETKRIPASHIVGWVYAAGRDGGSELLGERLLEFAPDAIRHENRDDEMRYVAYVPLGSINRGKHMVQSGSDSPANACSLCHGPQLRGIGLIPPIAGRSPTYILRQLLAFQTGARAGAAGEPMRAVVKNLRIAEMINAAAYVGTLPP